MEMLEANPNTNRGPWCSVCSAEKKADNYWWLIWIEVGVLHLRHFTPGIEICDYQMPVCGETCALKKISEFMKGEQRR